MKKKNMSIFFSLAVVFTAGIFFIISKEKQNRVCFENHCFKVELALTPEEQSYGLMFRKALGEKAGMLFVFNKEANYPFWMKNTLIPLDIIWLNKEKEVVFISRDVRPCQNDFCPSVDPDESAQYVLELNSGMADDVGLKIGDKMSF